MRVAPHRLVALLLLASASSRCGGTEPPKYAERQPPVATQPRPQVDVVSLLRAELPPDAWNTVPARYAGWCQVEFERLIEIAADALGSAPADEDLQRARGNVPALAHAVATYAASYCKPADCDPSMQQLEDGGSLNRLAPLACPLFPWC
jgi:hypothetical protein